MSYQNEFLRQRRAEAIGKKMVTIKEVVTGSIAILFTLGVLYLATIVLTLM
jgi:hypothetical protein